MSKTCPFCKADIPTDARKCKHCGEWVDASDNPRRPDGITRIQLVRTPLSGWMKVGLFLIVTFVLLGAGTILALIIYTATQIR